MNKLQTILARLREPSSLAGITALAVLAGRSLPQAQAYADAAAMAAGVLSVLVPEGKGAK